MRRAWRYTSGQPVWIWLFSEIDELHLLVNEDGAASLRYIFTALAALSHERLLYDHLRNVDAELAVSAAKCRWRDHPNGDRKLR